MRAAHKKTPPNRYAVLDDIPYERQRRSRGLPSLFLSVTGRRFIHAKVCVVPPRPDENRDFIPAELHSQCSEDG